MTAIKTYFRRISSWKWALLISVCVFIYGYSEKGWDNNYIHSDGLGYYAYLPATFIYHDFTFGFIEKYEKEHYQLGQHYDFRQQVPEGYVNRYYVGTAVLQLPFFLINHGICLATNRDACGYSHAYQYTILFAACFYLFIGIWTLMLILRFYIPRFVSWLVPILILLSTPLLFYTIYNPDFSHIYSFAIINLFILSSLRFFRKPSSGKMVLLFVWIGLIAIIRPINILIVLLLPFFAGNWHVFIDRLNYVFKKYGILLLGVVVFFSIVFIQLGLYFIQTGHFWVYSYGQYGFDFLHPHFTDILFSYRKGLFIYTPILFVSLGGFYYLFRRNAFKALYLFAFLCFLVYILSSWSFWTYGMTYGQRPFIEFYALFAILLGLMITQIRGTFKLILAFLLLLLCLHNLVQMSQHRHYILHWDDMDKEKYWKVFLRTDPVYYGYLWNPIAPIMDDTSGYVPAKYLSNQPEITIEPQQALPLLSVHSDSTADSLNIILSFKIFPVSEHLKRNTLHITTRHKQDIHANGYDFDINLRNIEPHKWNEVQKLIKLSKRTTDEEFLINIYNKGKYNFRLSNIRILIKHPH